MEQQGLVDQIREIQVVEYRGERVVTLAMMDELHQRPKGTGHRTFRRHRGKLIDGVDYHQISSDELLTFNVNNSPGRPSEVLLTESGYLMLVKSFRDDLAWDVQRALVNHYFRSSADLKADLPLRQIGDEVARGLHVGLARHQAAIDTRFDHVDQEIVEVKGEIGGVKERLEAIEHKVIRRRKLTSATKRQHIDTIHWLGGKCPCCSEIDVVDEYCNATAEAEWDHWFAPHRAAAHETWLICKPCNRRLIDHESRMQAQRFFDAYQSRRDQKHCPLFEPFNR